MALAGLATGCSEGVQPDQREVVYFTAIETDQVEPEVIPDPGPSVTKAQSSGYDPIVNGFLQNHERLIAREDITTQIDRIERVFTALGKFHQLVAIYRDDYEERGVESHVADRLAWAYIRLGQRKKARETLDELLAARPQDPMVHFLDGAFYLQREQRTVEQMRNLVGSWKRVVELDPNFSGPEGLNAQVLKQQIAKFEQQIEQVDPGGGPKAAVSSAGEMVWRALATAPTKPVPEVAPEPEEPQSPTIPAEGESDEEEPTEGEEVAEAPTEPAPAPKGPKTKAQRYRLLVAKGEIALSQGKYGEAKQMFLQARAVQPQGFDGEFGHLKARWAAEEQARNDVSTQMRALADRKGLTAKQKVELATFLWTKMARKDLAKRLYEEAADDPRVGTRAKRMLDQMSK